VCLSISLSNRNGNLSRTHLIRFIPWDNPGSCISKSVTVSVKSLLAFRLNIHKYWGVGWGPLWGSLFCLSYSQQVAIKIEIGLPYFPHPWNGKITSLCYENKVAYTKATITENISSFSLGHSLFSEFIHLDSFFFYTELRNSGSWCYQVICVIWVPLSSAQI
jgi:hypothetical protein